MHANYKYHGEWLLTLCPSDICWTYSLFCHYSVLHKETVVVLVVNFKFLVLSGFSIIKSPGKKKSPEAICHVILTC